MKQFLLIVCVLACFTSHGQTTMSAQLPPAGFVQKDQLWNLVIVNNKDGITEATLRMNMMDVQTGLVVLSATTGTFILGRGTKVLRANEIQPIAYNYSLPDMIKNYLPMGSYVVCYQLLETGVKENPLTEECVRINIDPLSPPMLNQPANKSEISTAYPQFSWIPPAPFEMFTSLTYDLLVTEVIEGQNPVEAIEMNAPVYYKTNLLQPFESYSSSFSKLDTGKIYAWQVIAKNGTNYSGKTEVWTFKLFNRSIEDIISLAPFIKLGAAVTEISIAQQGVLKMELENNGQDSIAEFVVRNLNKEKLSKSYVFKMKIPVKPGQNFLTYDMNRHGRLNASDVYEVEFVRKGTSSYYMRFVPLYYNKKQD